MPRGLEISVAFPVKLGTKKSLSSSALIVNIIELLTCIFSIYIYLCELYLDRYLKSQILPNQDHCHH